MRDKITKRFGSIDSSGPEKFLEERGYKLTHAWEWKPKQGIYNEEQVPDDEREAMIFLIDEWDYGGLNFLDARDTQ